MNAAAVRTAEFKDGEFWEKHNSDRAQARIEKNQKSGPCCHACGAVLNPDRAVTVRIVGGGGEVLHPEDADRYINDGGDMGAWDLGPECAKMFPAAYRAPYAGSAR